MFLNPMALFLSAVLLSLLGSAAAQDKVCRLEEVDAAMSVRYVSVVSSEYVFIARHFLFRDQDIYEVKINWTAKRIDLVEKFKITKYWPGWKGTKVTRTFSYQKEWRENFTTAVIGDHQHTTLARFDKDTLELIAGSNRTWNFDSLSQVIETEKNVFNRDRPLNDETRAINSGIYNRGTVIVFNYPMPSGSTQKKNYSTISVYFTEESDKLFQYAFYQKTRQKFMKKFLSNFNWNEMKMIGVLSTEISLDKKDAHSGFQKEYALVFLVQHGNRMYNCFGVISGDIATCTQLAEYQETEIWEDTVDCEKHTPKPLVVFLDLPQHLANEPPQEQHEEQPKDPFNLVIYVIVIVIILLLGVVLVYLAAGAKKKRKIKRDCPQRDSPIRQIHHAKGAISLAKKIKKKRKPAVKSELDCKMLDALNETHLKVLNSPKAPKKKHKKKRKHKKKHQKKKSPT